VKLTVPQLAKQFLRYYMNRSFIPFSTISSHRFLSWASWIQFATIRSLPGHTTGTPRGMELYFSVLPPGAWWEMPVCWRMALSFFRNRNCPKNRCFNDPQLRYVPLSFHGC
jgi:hypothetical protein